MKLVAQLRVKNQILTINECLTKLSELVDEIVIVDNGSTDGTFEVYKKFPKIKKVAKTKGFNEGRDKILAHQLAKEQNPDWIIWIDGDEIFEQSTSRRELDEYMNNSKLNEVRFRMFNFWLSKYQYRIDGRWLQYTANPQRQMWRNLPSAHFENYLFHNGGITGLPRKSIVSHIRIKHYGYIDKKQIKDKYQNYKLLENNERAKKTLPVNKDNLKLEKWQEFSHPLLNRFWQEKEKLRWQLISLMNI